MAFWEVGHRWGLQTSWGEPQGRSCCFVHIRGVQDGGLFQCTGAEGAPGFCGVEAGRVGSLEENPGAGPPRSSQASVLVMTWPWWSHLLVLTGQPQATSLFTDFLLFRKKRERNHYNRQEEEVDGRCFISKN